MSERRAEYRGHHQSGARPALKAGKLGARSLAVLLADANERGINGTLTLSHPTAHATIVFRAGRVVSVRSNDVGPYLGALLYENGVIDAATLDRTLFELAKTKK